MTALIRNTLAITLLLALSANKCNQGGAAGTPPSPTDRQWTIHTLDGKALNVPEGVERPWLKLTSGDVVGFGGCNTLMGGYTLEGAKLSFSDIGSTKMYCEEVQATEEAIIGMLRQVDGCTLKGNALELLGGGKALAVLRSE